jgi:hypothetical protein
MSEDEKSPTIDVEVTKKRQKKKHYEPDNEEKFVSPEEVERRKRNATDNRP